MFKRRSLEILVLVVLTLIIILISHFYSKDNTGEVPFVTDDITEAEPETEYGIVIDSLNLIRDKVKRNQNLSEILSAYGVDYSIIDIIARKSKETF